MKRKEQTSELTKWPLETGFRDTDRTRRLVSTLDKLRPTSLLSPDELDPTPPFLEIDLPLLSSTTPRLLSSALVPTTLDARLPEFPPPPIDFPGKASFSGGESPLQNRGLSLLFKNSGDDEEPLEKALTLLDLLGGGRLWASREASLTEGDGVAPLPELAEEAGARGAAPLLEADLKAETAIDTERRGKSRKEGREWSGDTQRDKINEIKTQRKTKDEGDDDGNEEREEVGGGGGAALSSFFSCLSTVVDCAGFGAAQRSGKQ